MKRKPKFNIRDIQRWFDESESSGQLLRSPADPIEKYAKSQLRVIRETKDYQLDYLRHALMPGKTLIDTAPSYQRRLRWTMKQRSLLIESFLLNIPVPPIFLYEVNYNEYELIDGRQRVETIRDFLEDKFALVGLEYWPELDRKRFSDLPDVLQKGLFRRSLSAVVLLAETGSIDIDDLDVRRVLFDRLNTGGVSLNPQELRNSLYPGEFNALLSRLARTYPFTEIWGIPPYSPGEEENPPSALLKNTLYSTFADAELVLRFFALRDAIENERQGSLRKILDRYMKENADADGFRIANLKQEFTSLVQRLYDVFLGEPFVLPKTSKPSRPLYDALMVALSQKPDLDIEANAGSIREALSRALQDKKNYDILVGRGNTIESVRSRVKLSAAILRGRDQIDT